MTNRGFIVRTLIRLGLAHMRSPRAPYRFSPKPRVNEIMNDIDAFPHLFVLGTQMDRGIESALAWEVPIRVREELSLASMEFRELRKPSLEELVRVFIRTGLHRYPAKMARIFHNTLERIELDYEGEAQRIWNDKPSSATLIRRLLQFDGMVLRMAAKAANMLYRDFKIPLSDASSLDVQPEDFVRRVFQRAGFVHRNASDEEVIYLARELFVRYPAIFAKPCQDITRHACWPERPRCSICILNRACMKLY